MIWHYFNRFFGAPKKLKNQICTIQNHDSRVLRFQECTLRFSQYINPKIGSYYVNLIDIKSFFGALNRFQDKIFTKMCHGSRFQCFWGCKFRFLPYFNRKINFLSSKKKIDNSKFFFSENLFSGLNFLFFYFLHQRGL